MANFQTQQSAILVVDDSPKNLQVLGNFLQNENYSTEFALDGQSALGWIERKNFDLILLDIMMPGMNGYEICSILKKDPETAEIPVIYLTSKEDTDSIIRAFETGAADFITKPFNRKELLARVATHIGIKKTRDELNKSLKEVEDKNHLITSSIKYAKYIQSALLKKSWNIPDYFSDSFSLDLPKDIVSGDFSWSSKVGNKTIVGVFDCTGHGVPGAFMSLLFVTFLNDIINVEKIYEPHLLLSRLRDKVIDALAQRGFFMELHDGMDAAIISYDSSEELLTFSGAFNKLYIAREGTIHEYRGDRIPVSYADVLKEFTLQNIKTQKGDVVYLFTDGYSDQFGGESGKKMGTARLKEILQTVCLMPLKDQGDILQKNLLEWQGENNEQVDDITAVGFRL